ncbi:hypothetical protein LguiB_027501 [Lonicera macranthoides]
MAQEGFTHIHSDKTQVHIVLPNLRTGKRRRRRVVSVGRRIHHQIQISKINLMGTTKKKKNNNVLAALINGRSCDLYIYI